MTGLAAAAIVFGLAALACFAAPAAEQPRDFDIEWSVRIAMRDGVKLSANAYRPRGSAPDRTQHGCIVSITPYGIERYHPRGTWFASRGYTFVAVDSRGRGGSAGTFRPFIQEAQDGYDAVEWLATQPECAGKIAMWGLSYMGYGQWATAKELPPHLATIVPVASGYMGLDFPMRENMPYQFGARFLSFVSSAALQERIFADEDYWTSLYREHAQQGRAFIDLAAYAGDRGATFREWAAHPHPDAYWDAYAPTAQQLAAIDIPILTITGSHDVDQPGALAYYRDHMTHGSAAAKARHHLVIGPWDHGGTMTPKAQFGGLSFAPQSVLDMNQLHLDWYNWSMSEAAKPQFLKDRVAYYVMGAEEWRYAPTLQAVTARQQPLHLTSRGSADDVFGSGTLQEDKPGKAGHDSYVYDPRDLSRAALERADPDSLIDQGEIYAGSGKLLVYHTRPFARAIEVSGTFRLQAWIAIDQPDTDFKVSIHEIKPDGSSILLSTALQRARYRHSLREPKLVSSREPLRYDFNSFTFVSRLLGAGSRLRLVIGPVNSINKQRNYNSGKPVAEETAADARVVTVRLFHGPRFTSALRVPIGRGAEWPR